MIYEPNPIICIITYYIFFPNFFKAILIIIFHTYLFSKYYIIKDYNFINNLNGNNTGRKFQNNLDNNIYNEIKEINKDKIMKIIKMISEKFDAIIDEKILLLIEFIEKVRPESANA